MQVLALHGSPREKGNSATILKWVTDELKDQGHKVEIERIKHDYNGCMACYHCRKFSDEIVCKVDTWLYEKMQEADAIIFATPLHCWSFPVGVKGVIDRSLCMVKDYMGPNHRSFVENKNFGLIVTGAGPVENNMDLITTLFKRYLGWVKGNYAAELLVPSCSEPENLDSDIHEKAQDFAARLVVG